MCAVNGFLKGIDLDNLILITLFSIVTTLKKKEPYFRYFEAWIETFQKRLHNYVICYWQRLTNNK